VNSPVKWYGGKGPIAKWVIDHFPPRSSFRRYGEVFGGGASVLLNLDPPCEVEAYNDLDSRIVNLFRVLRDWPGRFCESLALTPYAQEIFDDSLATREIGNDIDRAAADFVLWRQSVSARGQTWAKAINRSRCGMADNVSAWWGAIDGLPEVIARLKRVQIHNEDCSEFIGNFDGPDCLLYCDPPYVHGTRSVPKAYAHEMTDTQHAHLCILLKNCKSKVCLSGYDNEIYRSELKGWRTVSKDVQNRAGLNSRATETLWMNY
jgi:DNA adenine methylase